MAASLAGLWPRPFQCSWHHLVGLLAANLAWLVTFGRLLRPHPRVLGMSVCASTRCFLAGLSSGFPCVAIVATSSLFKHSPPPKGGTQAGKLSNSPDGYMVTGDQGGGGIVGFPCPPKGSGLGQRRQPCQPHLCAGFLRPSPPPGQTGKTVRQTWRSGCSNEKKWTATPPFWSGKPPEG